ncbi:Rossmann-like and DUF2520 domain-containing protein [Aureibacter tunicatorum]|uniref:Short-subunit dehydrogenase-like oxidoreductase (DUF2520 family) n=1 Tax=Aureibacter tunicatorum TaxID=866807 RepID=A0AAE4BRP7_9BACT|nr:DUF2520 domain-containing protein [Aureibacter tunicatorum]MDR6238138.1 putative short-subunit dehydrogenase-like oxidoreductase (DUF2520 family) [Aureibacter tunicatorum]BDD03171.1 hypothetical protein AUTU_06540 [Aureibacter tunicatorum]
MFEKKKLLRIGIIGAGKVAWHLAPALENAGHKVVCLYNRNKKNGKALMNRLYNTDFVSEPDFSGKNIDVILLISSDDSLAEISKEIIMDESCILAHTSGTASINRLSFAATDHLGVFYPLQTFSKDKSIEFDNIPICIEGSDDKTLGKLEILAKSLSNTVKQLHGNDRKSIHLAAVFACNFSNHMMTIAKQIMGRNKLDFDLMKPLIAETINKSMAIGPDNGQTGPAVRGDFKTLDNHMNQLKGNHSYQNIYKAITDDILEKYFYDE